MTQARTYPGADRETQWRGVDRPTMSSVDKLLLHTTESAGWPSYPTFSPTLTFNPWKPRGSRWRQHCYINQAATTLANAGTYRTNRADVVQIEVVAYCDPAKRASSAHIDKISADAYHDLAEFYAWLHKEWGTELFLYPKWKPYPDSYGISNGVRMTTAQFGTFKGLCGHMHAPQQSHGDPGSLKVGLIVDTAQNLAGDSEEEPEMVNVTPEQIEIAKAAGMQNVEIIAQCCNEQGARFYITLAMLEKETGSCRNVYGHDAGGALSGFPGAVNKDNFAVFRWLVFTKGQTSNGVGPAQLTFRGFFTDMEAKGLKPYDLHDNIAYGAKLIQDYYRAGRVLGKSVSDALRYAGTKYNGSSSYGDAYLTVALKWKERVGSADYAPATPTL